MRISRSSTLARLRTKLSEPEVGVATVSGCPPNTGIPEHAPSTKATISAKPMVKSILGLFLLIAAFLHIE